MADLDNILIVDDKPENLDVLIDYLDSFGFSIFVARNGEEAIKLAEKIMPDIILLDVIMPGIDGFETCRHLKENENTREIPVIFMTALSDTVNKVTGFKIGGVDYVTKPLQHEEVLARIRAHLTIRLQQKKLEKQNEELHKLNQEKNEFLGIVSHDLKNPLNNIIGIAEILKSFTQDKAREWVTLIEADCKRMYELIIELLDINRLESGKTSLSLQRVELSFLLFESVYRHRLQAEAKQIQLHFERTEEKYHVYADKSATTQIFDNLISNAVKYSPSGKKVNIRIFQSEKLVRCEIQDEGQGITDKDQQKIFGKFARLSARPTGGENSTGLGLSIVKKLVEAMNGQVWAESEGKDKGSIFIVEFPKLQL
jgi:signal transduction histidine kinase